MIFQMATCPAPSFTKRWEDAVCESHPVFSAGDTDMGHTGGHSSPARKSRLTGPVISFSVRGPCVPQRCCGVN